MLRPVSPFIEYAINYNYISEVLCINQDKPEMNCKGKCYVMQQIEKQKNDDFKSLQISMKEYPIGFVKLLSISQVYINQLYVAHTFSYENRYNYIALVSIFHPPNFHN